MNFTAKTLARVEYCWSCCCCAGGCSGPPPPLADDDDDTVHSWPAITEADGGTIYRFCCELRCCSLMLAISAFAFDGRPAYACRGTIGQLYAIYGSPTKQDATTRRNPQTQREIITIISIWFPDAAFDFPPFSFLTTVFISILGHPSTQTHQPG